MKISFDATSNGDRSLTEGVSRLSSPQRQLPPHQIERGHDRRVVGVQPLGPQRFPLLVIHTGLDAGLGGTVPITTLDDMPTDDEREDLSRAEQAREPY